LHYYDWSIFNYELKLKSLSVGQVHRIDCYNRIFSIARINHVSVTWCVTSAHADHAVSNELNLITSLTPSYIADARFDHERTCDQNSSIRKPHVIRLADGTSHIAFDLQPGVPYVESKEFLTNVRVNIVKCSDQI